MIAKDYLQAFNRTIVELKLNLDAGAVIGKRSFNRTIVELKLWNLS